MNPPNHPYSITFPIWKCPQWSALRGRLKFTDEQVVVARWNDTTFLDEEIAFLEAHYRIKPIIEGRAYRPAHSLLPSVLQIVRTNSYTDLILDNCQQWQLGQGDLSKLLSIYFAYNLYEGQSPRDCTLENIIRCGDSIVVLDFGLRKRTEKYSVYWNPLILKGRPYYTSYQWSLGIMYLVMTQGAFILNEVHKLIAEWLKGGRLDIATLLTSKKASIRLLISELLDPENPIPWENIPHHSAFRDDNNCRSILKDFDIRSDMDIKQRSTSRSRIASRAYSPLLTVIPMGRKDSVYSDAINLNQSLITRISNHYNNHKEKVKSAITKSSSQGKIVLKLSTQLNKEYFTTTKTAPKQCRTQASPLKTLRNTSQNTTNTLRYPADEDKLSHIIPRRISQSPLTLKLDIRQRSRGSSFKNSIMMSEQKTEKTIGSNEKLPTEKVSRELSRRESQIIDGPGDNYIQLIRKPIDSINKFILAYTRCLDCINIIGQSVAKCLEILNGLQNFWVIPLFLVFKRMHQLRLEVQSLLDCKENVLKLMDWEEVLESVEYGQFMYKVQNDNDLVHNELMLLLKAAKSKADKLDKVRKDKVQWFLNEDMSEDIDEIMQTYCYGQIYKTILDKKGLKKPIIEWLKVQMYVQATLIVSRLPILQYETFNIEKFNQVLLSEDIECVQQYLEENQIDNTYQSHLI